MSGERKNRSRYSLSAEDRALWEKVKKTAKPLRRSVSRTETAALDNQRPGATTRSAAPVFDPKGGKPKPAKQIAPAAAKPLPRPAAGAPAKAPAPNRIDRRTIQRIARGTTHIDARIDLHGMTQRNAHGHLLRFLASAQTKGHKVVLVITGKGTQKPDSTGFHQEIGVLRRAVPMWLQEPAFRLLVVGFELAHKSHGGEGALYVRLRRRRADGYNQAD